MAAQIKGQIKSINEEYFNCLDIANLRVKIFKVLFGSLEQISTSTEPAISSEGAFSYTVPATVKTFLAKLYLVDNGVEIFVTESPKFCQHDTADIEFNIDESKYGRPVLDKLKSRLTAAGLSDLTAIISLSPKQLDELSCISCITYGTLTRLQSACQLWKACTDYVYSPVVDAYSDGRTLWTTFKTETDNGRAAFFALLRFLSTSLPQVVGFSRTQFNTNIQNTITLNELGTSLLTPDLLNKLEGSRNIILFNSKNDKEFVDAKIIHLTDLSYSLKNTILNETLDAVGLSGVKLAVDANHRKVGGIRTLNDHTMNFPPGLAHLLGSTAAEPDYFALAAGGLAT